MTTFFAARELAFDAGREPRNKCIDIPPFVHDWTGYMRRTWGERAGHIKVSALSMDGFASTCFGILVVKGD